MNMGVRRYLLFMIGMLIIHCVDMGSNTYQELEPKDIPNIPTYTEDVQPILARHCLSCHSLNNAHTDGGLSYDVYLDAISIDRRLEDYPDSLPHNYKAGQKYVYGWDGIRTTAIEQRSMPPGGLQRLNSREISILTRWASLAYQK